MEQKDETLEREREQGKRLTWRVSAGAVGVLAICIVGIAVMLFVTGHAL